MKEKEKQTDISIKDNIIISRFKELVEEYKRNNNVSYKDISDKLNMSSQSLTNYTTSRVPNIEILTNACNIFNVTLDYLCGLSNIKEKENNFGDLGLNQNSINFLKNICINQNNDIKSYLALIIINELLDDNNEFFKELVSMLLSKKDILCLSNFDSIDELIKYISQEKKKKIKDINTYLIAKGIEEFIEKVYRNKEKEINSFL